MNDNKIAPTKLTNPAINPPIAKPRPVNAPSEFLIWLKLMKPKTAAAKLKIKAKIKVHGKQNKIVQITARMPATRLIIAMVLVWVCGTGLS
jgi:hypothetical protein